MTTPALRTNPLPVDPHAYLAALDAEGNAYWLEDVEFVNGTKIGRADVMGHGPDYLTLRENRDTFDMQTGPVWTARLAHVVRFRVMEG
jgi:hypothetical protein